ncbi:hypothetical protein KGF57_001112 [Candida theae]|uniref:Fumarylacetoacetase-like C-terminal domain-containing protein n=1 Tax=Candida theae TaxID=1198502 RepID=A0AAD5G012_9ASCO|nr:uncharacterized protein KGF57_001112 [Candida theae]KAI5964001.1 hypothetical protein KGF57_001112 [Candida theae]
MSLKYIDNARKILCIGRNYAAHIKELNSAKPQQPFFFLKPSSAVLKPNAGPFLIPKGTVVHHEVELAFTLNRELKNLPDTFSAQDALDSIEGYALTIDMTARNVQDEAKKKGLPWSIGKGFDTFLPVSGFIPKEKIPDPYDVELKLTINGDVKQKDRSDLMIFPIHKILSYMSNIMTLEKGDLILTGTPKGVGPIVDGDVVEATLSVGENIIESIKISAETKPGYYVYKET